MTEQMSATELELRERIARLRKRGGHQEWCSLFGETVGWHDGLIHLIEPFIFKLYAQIYVELTRPFTDHDRGKFETMMSRALAAEKRAEQAEAKIALMLKPSP